MTGRRPVRGARVVSQLHRHLRSGGSREVAQRLVRRAAQRLDVASLDLGLDVADVADSSRLALAAARPRPAGAPLTVGWLTTPPGAGSGGHTTMFRMVQALERRGHRCVVVLHDVHHGDHEDQARVIRSGWPGVQAEVRPLGPRALADLDACFATGWETAHVLASRAPADVHRFYFVQDFEPYFYPRGSLYELAADTYRFGFHTIALGHMVHGRLAELGARSSLVPFSCDTEVYSLQRPGPRSGVVLYAKPQTPRRGFLLARLALVELHRRRPDQEIHVFGSAADLGDLPVTRHPALPPSELAELYGSVAAGLAMSFTNISLVAEEMLAAGCVPVVNDSPDARADLVHPHVQWAAPTPGAIADALCRAVDAQRSPDHPGRVAVGVRGDAWRTTGDLVATLVEDTVRATPTPSPTPNLTSTSTPTASELVR